MTNYCYCVINAVLLAPLNFIDIFPTVFTYRIAFNGHRVQKSAWGGVAAIVYVFVLTALIRIAAIPVFQEKNPKLGSATLAYD